MCHFSVRLGNICCFITHLLVFSSKVPLTLYGFAIAATWLDAIADKLVEILELFGILLEIPLTVLGLTVLAFRNSIQDLVANFTLSKKGLSTMATTASFAGPIFNLCVGLGFGSWALMKNTGMDKIQAELHCHGISILYCQLWTGYICRVGDGKGTDLTRLRICCMRTVLGKCRRCFGPGIMTCHSVYFLISLYV